jgi:CRISPR-associated protein Cas5d
MVSVKIWGDYACFSRPEFKVERVSYPIITPSAARGVLEAIYWKPAFRFQIRRIHVVSAGIKRPHFCRFCRPQ